MLRVIGAGLSRTGTHSLHLALQTLGLSSLHFDQTRLNDILFGETPHPDFHRYSDIEAVCDLPTACFYQELADAYPKAKIILTVRDPDLWWPSIRAHFTTHAVTNETRLKFRIARKFGVSHGSLREPDYDVFRRAVRRYVYGSTVPREFLYKKKFIEHNALVMKSFAPERLLVMDITAGDGWDKLCPFLGLPAPTAPFPHVGPMRAPANDRALSRQSPERVSLPQI